MRTKARLLHDNIPCFLAGEWTTLFGEWTTGAEMPEISRGCGAGTLFGEWATGAEMAEISRGCGAGTLFGEWTTGAEMAEISRGCGEGSLFLRILERGVEHLLVLNVRPEIIIG